VQTILIGVVYSISALVRWCISRSGDNIKVHIFDKYRDPKWLDSNYWTTKKKPLLVPNHDNLGGIYQLVRNCPVGLFSFPSPHVLLKQKDDSILNLELANKALRQQLEEQAKEIEQLKKLGGPTPPNKRVKTSDNNESRTTGDIESRFAALEADVALLKQKMK